MAPVGIALVGAGPWGLTLARTLARIEEAQLRWICELDGARLRNAGAVHGDVRLTSDLRQALADPEAGAVVVAVEPPRQHAIGLQVLAAGKHLFVEKPMALSVAHATELVEAAARGGRFLGAGYLLLHHPAVRRAQQLIAHGALGNVLYLEASRIAPGTARAGQSAWWTLAPHDVSLALRLFDACPVSVSASGGAFVVPEGENVAFATLRFADGRLAHIDVARVAAEKKRQFSIAGSRRALTFDELDEKHPLRIHSTEPGAPPERAEVLPLDGVDPLDAQCRQFVSSVARGDLAGGNGKHALDVVRVLEAGAKSMRAGGAPIEVA